MLVYIYIQEKIYILTYICIHVKKKLSKKKKELSTALAKDVKADSTLGDSYDGVLQYWRWTRLNSEHNRN